MSDTTTDDAGGVEEKARALGWKSADEWVGDTSNHMTADKFLETQEKLAAKADAAAQKRIGALNAEMKELKQTISELGDHLKKADQRALERARQEIQVRMDMAVEEGDTAGYRKAQSDLAGLTEEVTAAAAPAKKEPEGRIDPEAEQLFNDFQAANEWYGPNGDPKATIYANRMAKEVADSGFSGKKFYDAVTELVKEEFPHLFGEQKSDARTRPAPVEGVSGGGGKGKTPWEQVDADGKAAFDRFWKAGVYKGMKIEDARKKYALDWGADE